MRSETRPPVTVVGIGADGWEGLSEASRAALRAADVILGGARQLALVPSDECDGVLEAWPTSLRQTVRSKLARLGDRRVAVLASGDPMFHGVGRTLCLELGPERVRVLPHPSSFSYACARLGWAAERTAVVSVVNAPVAVVAALLHDRRRLIVLSAAPRTADEIARLLREHGFGPSRMWVLEQLDSSRERLVHGTADTWDATPGDRLNLVAVDCRRAPGALRLGAVPGLPDEAYETVEAAPVGEAYAVRPEDPADTRGADTRTPETGWRHSERHVRAAALAALAPAPGERLWDIGGGSGTVAIEWMRVHPSCTAVAVEGDAARRERITRNAKWLGVPGLQVTDGRASEAPDRLPAPDAVFLSGALNEPWLLETCWAALPAGGRLVAHATTLEGEALLADWHRSGGGELVRLQVADVAPVDGATIWRPAAPVTQWSVTKGSRPGVG